MKKEGSRQNSVVDDFVQMLCCRKVVHPDATGTL